MSRSNPEIKLESPCTRYFEWNGDAGGFKWYNKATKEKVAVPLPFTFIVLDCLVTISGFSDSQQSGFWSNEIKKKDIKNSIFKVRSKQGLNCEGTWEAIKGKETGMKYCESVYIAYVGDDKKLTIGNIKFMGAGLSPWINFCSGEKDDKGKKISEPNDPYVGAITVATMKEGKKGKTIYQMPVFTTKSLKPETEEAVKEMDKQLQEYLIQYFAKNVLDTAVKETVTPTPEEVEATFHKTEEPSSQLSAKEVAMAKQEAKSNAIEEENDLPW